MSKKIIAAIIAFTLVFVFVFAACKDNGGESNTTTTENNVYNKDLSLYVTDENGNRVYNSNGEPIIHVTDENGKFVTKENGEYETVFGMFEPISEGGEVEYYSYSIDLPDGWKITNESNRFVHEEANHTAAVSVINESYESYYEKQKNTYDDLAKANPDAVSWSEDISIGSGCIKVVRFMLQYEGRANVMYFYENSGNLYKVFFESTSVDTVIRDSEAFCKAMSYKPYLYYEPESTTETSE